MAGDSAITEFLDVMDSDVHAFIRNFITVTE